MAGGVLLFNRDAVGIKGNQMWTDNQMFVNIGNGIGKLAGDSGRPWRSCRWTAWAGAARRTTTARPL